MKKFWSSNDEGSIVVDAMGSIGILVLAMAGAMTLSFQLSETQRTSINAGMATNFADEALTNASTDTWSKVGTTGAPPANTLGAGVEAVTTGIYPVSKTQSMRGTPMTVSTAVGWLDKPSTGSSYGRKVVIVKVTWDNFPSGRKHTITQSRTITPSLNQVAPKVAGG